VQGRELRARGQATMQKLLDAGIEVFSTKGYHAARVDDIVAAAATSHGTFYLYFANKDELFEVMLGTIAGELAVVIDALDELTPDDAGRAAVRSWLESFAAMYARYGPLIRTWTESETGRSEAGRLGTDVLTDLAVGLARRLPPAATTDVDPMISALALMAMVERFNYFVAGQQVPATADELLDTLADIVFESLFATGAAP
jgi:AcrR family transcriptional regulator